MNLLSNACFVNDFENWVNDGYWSISNKGSNPPCANEYKATKLGPIHFDGKGLPGVEGALYQVVELPSGITQLTAGLTAIWVRVNYFRLALYGSVLSDGPWEPLGQIFEVTGRAKDWQTLSGIVGASTPFVRYETTGMFPENSLGIKFNGAFLVGE